MKRLTVGAAAFAVAVAGFAVFGTGVKAQDPLFGDAESVEFALAVWEAMEDQKLVGENAIRAFPYVGGPPHGDILVTLESMLSVGGRTATVIVKKNYTLEFATVEDVANNPGQQHDVTVMFRREAGYDDDNHDWFWAKYTADGEILAGPPGPLAGRVYKGLEAGCIACPSNAPGGDMAFINDRHAM